MSQNKPRPAAGGTINPAPASVGKKKSPNMWKPSGSRGAPIAVIAIIGVVAIVATYLAQLNALFTLRKDTDDLSLIRISEVMADNRSTLITDTGDAPDWIEIENAGAVNVKLNNYSLMTSSDINRIFTFPNIALAPGERMLIYCDGANTPAAPEYCAPFKISASGGETLALLNAKDTEIDAVELPELSADQVYCRDDAGAWQVSDVPTPGEANIASIEDIISETKVNIVDGDLEITEVMSSNTLYYPDETGKCTDYVEIHNKSGMPVDLTGWHLADSANKLKKWSFGDYTIPAGGYIVVHCDGENRASDVNHIHTDFKISGRGEVVYLTDPEGRTVSMAAVPAMEANQALSRDGEHWVTTLPPTPGAANNSGATRTAARNTTGVYINEIMASPTEQQYDWVEICNGTAGDVDISGWGLSDNAARPRKWQFPRGTVIHPGEYLGVFCSGLDTDSIGGFLNADFALSADGGYTMSLSTSDGKVVDSAYIPVQYAGISYGRLNSDSDFCYFEAGTPGTANTLQAYFGRAQTPAYSVPGGLFHSGDSFYVTLSAEGDSRIYYTLDCTDPTESSTLYRGEQIPVTGNTIIRTRVYRDGYMPSFMDTQSYLFDVNNEDTVYVVSLVSDAYNLTDENYGIMVKGPNATSTFPYGSMNEGANFWMDWEREAHVELFTAQGEDVMSNECGIKLHGQYSRAADVKAFKVIARSEYGSNRFEYPIFTHRDYTEYQSFLIRASGQDYCYTFMRDSILTSLARNTSVMYQESEPCILYINGQYYSLMYLRERINTHSICQFENWEGMEDDLDLVKADSREMQGSNATYAALIDWLKNNDTSTQEAYEKIDSTIDLQNYIEYMAIEIFVGNGDTANVKRYRNALADGKWRWVLFDLDWAFFVDTDSIRRWRDPAGMGTNMNTDTTLFRACMNNPIIYDRFMTYFGQQLATTFSTENVLGMIEERYYLIDGLLPDYLDKLGMSQDEYNEKLSDLVYYAKTRPAKILGYFDGQFHFSDEEKQKYFGDAVAKIQAAN